MSKIIILLAILIIVPTCVLRVIKINNIPIFHDEAIYLNTSREIKITDFNSWKQSFYREVQKPPLVLLLIKPIILNNDNDFIRARVLSAFFGILAVYLAFLLSFKMWGRVSAIVSLCFFSFSPFLIFYQRLFLFESFLLFFFLLTFYIFEKFIKKPKVTFAAILIFLIFLLVSLKQSVFIWLPVMILLPFIQGKKPKIKNWLVGIGVLTAGLISSLGFYFFYIGFDYYFIPNNNLASMDLGIGKFWQNLLAICSWFRSYTTLFGLLIFSFILLFSLINRIKNKKLDNYFLFLFLVFYPLILQALISRYFFARYLYLSYALFLFLVAREFSYLIILRKKWIYSLFFIILIIFINFDFKIVFQPQFASLHENEKWQYFNGWPSGWGVKEISNLIKKEAGQNTQVAVIGEQIMPASGLTYYLTPSAIQIKEYAWDVNKDLLTEDYLVFQVTEENKFIAGAGYTLVAIVEKPDSQTLVKLYKKNKLNE